MASVTLVIRAVLVVLAALLAVPAASASPAGRYHAAFDNEVSSNWAGYAISGTNLTTGAPTQYTNVTGSWVQPKANCKAGESYSAFWVGLGGFSGTSTALEQIGTE